jgi:hypothetical protein
VTPARASASHALVHDVAIEPCRRLRLPALALARLKAHIDGMKIVMGMVVVALFVLLAAATYYAVGIWNALESANMPTWMYVAMGGGILFSLLVGCGLMALVFYSNRYGYDDAASGRIDD